MASLDASDIAPEGFRPLRRTEYDRMVELGLFDDDERVELLGGALISMSPQRARHADVVRRLTELLAASAAGKAQLRVQLPLAISDVSEPEPDLSLVPPGDYSKEHPSAALLVIEVADTTLKKDLGVKARLYAAAGVPEYWVVNLIDDVIVVHTAPSAEGYVDVRRHDRAATLVPIGIEGVTLGASAILG